MAQYFLDTSAFVKYYHPEAGTEKVASLFAQPARLIWISSLGVLETQSVFAMKVRAGLLNRKVTGVQRARLMLDIAAGEVEVVRVTSDHFAAAERLIGRHGFSRRLRTLDALQLAVALDLRNQELTDCFVAADKSLLEVATLEGISVVDPEAS